MLGRECVGLSYSRMVNGLSRAGIEIDRKVLSNLATEDMSAFTQLAERAKVSLIR